MPILSKDELLSRICDAIEASGWKPIVLQRQHPFKLVSVTEGRKPQTFLIYIWNLTPGGPPNVRPSDEYRIQMTGLSSPLPTGPDFVTILLGWHEDLKVFAGFDAHRHLTFRSRSPSIEVKQSTMEQASNQGLAFRARVNNEIVVAFTSDQFMNYALQQRQLHLFRRPLEADLLQLAAKGEEVAEEALEIVPRERREVVRTVREWSRRRDFRDRVLRAYSYSCAICKIQLRLIEAAHIVPIGAPESNDLTSNRLALCLLHHGAYDDGLLAVNEAYHVLVNSGKMQRLESERLAVGKDLLTNLVCQTIMLPGEPNNWPRPDFLRLGMRYRGW